MRTSTQPTPTKRIRVLGGVGLLLCLIAVATVLIPGVGYVQAQQAPDVRVTAVPRKVALPANSTYGVYVTDADNSGYTESCSAVDAAGNKVRIEEPSTWGISFEETEMLDFVFGTGSGKLTISCDVPGEQVVVRPVPNDKAMLISILLAGVTGCAGFILLVASLAMRKSRRARTPE